MADSCGVQWSITSAPSTQTRTASSLIVRNVYRPAPNVTVVVASIAQCSMGSALIAGPYHS